jgi:hypothetical protein
MKEAIQIHRFLKQKLQRVEHKGNQYCKKEVRNCNSPHSKIRRFDDPVHRFSKTSGAM